MNDDIRMLFQEKQNMINELERTLNTFSDENEAIKYLQNVVQYAENNPELKRKMCKYEILDREDNTQKKFYEKYLDIYRKNHPTNNLSMEGITTTTINDEDLIHYKDSEGTDHILENRDPNKPLAEQLQDIQSKYVHMQDGSGEENKDAVMKEFKDEKAIEYELTDTTMVNKDSLTADQRRVLEAVSNYENYKDKNLSYNAEKQLFVDKDTGDIYYIATTQDGEKELRKAEQDYTQTIDIENDAVEDALNESQPDLNTPGSEIEGLDEEVIEKVSALTYGDLEYAFSHMDEIEDENYKKAVRYFYHKKEQEMLLSQQIISSDIARAKRGIKTLGQKSINPNDLWKREHAGFTSYVVLVFIVALYGIGFLTYLFIAIR